MVLPIIDMFLIDSWKTLIRVALALLAIAEPQILSSSFEESLIILKTFSRDLNLDVQKFLSNAGKYIVTRRLLADLEKHYYPTRAMNLSLEVNSEKKLQWVLVSTKKPPQHLPPALDLDFISPCPESEQKTPSKVPPTKKTELLLLPSVSFDASAAPRQKRLPVGIVDECDVSCSNSELVIQGG